MGYLDKLFGTGGYFSQNPFVAMLVTQLIASAIEGITAPDPLKQEFPEQRVPEQEKYFRSRVAMGVAMAKRRNIAREMTSMIMNKSPLDLDPGSKFSNKFPKEYAALREQAIRGDDLSYIQSIDIIKRTGLYEELNERSKVSADISSKEVFDPAYDYTPTDKEGVYERKLKRNGPAPKKLEKEEYDAWSSSGTTDNYNKWVTKGRKVYPDSPYYRGAT